MMKYASKRFLLMIMCLLIAFGATACQGAGGNDAGTSTAAPTGSASGSTLLLNNYPNSGTGRYVETDLDLQGYYGICGLSAYGNALYFAAVQGDLDDSSGATKVFKYENGAVEMLAFQPDPSYVIMNMAVDSQGNPVLVCIQDDREVSVWSKKDAVTGSEVPPAILLTVKDGSFQPVGSPIQDPSFLSLIAPLQDGGFLLGGEKCIHHLDALGSILDTFGQNVLALAVHEGTAFVLERVNKEDNSVLTGYDIASGKLSFETPMMQSSSGARTSNLAADPQGALYFANIDGLYRMAPGGEKFEQLMEGLASSLGNQGMSLGGIAVTEDGSIYVSSSIGKTGEESVYRYAWSSDASAVAQSTLNIVSVYDYYSLRAAISEYQRKHPEVKINYQSFVSGESQSFFGTLEKDQIADLTVQVDDAVRAINTEVLSGNCPDVLILDGLPLNSYIEKGILDDMTAWAGTRLTDGTWVNKIASAYLRDGKLPCVSTKFMLPVLWGERSQIANIQTMSDLTAIAQSLPQDQYLFAEFTDFELLEVLYPVCAPDWVGSNGRIDFSSPNFRTFLEQVNVIRPAVKLYTENVRLFFDDYMDGKIVLYRTNLYGPGAEIGPHSMTVERNQESGVCLVPSQSEKKVFLPRQVAGVGVSSANKALAYDFLETLVSDSIQELQDPEMFGYPINWAVLNEQVSPPKQDRSRKDMPGVKLGRREMTMESIDEATSQIMKDMIGKADTPTDVDYTLLNMIVEEVTPYLEGGKTLDEAIASLNARTKAYLAE